MQSACSSQSGGPWRPDAVVQRGCQLLITLSVLRKNPAPLNKRDRIALVSCLGGLSVDRTVVAASAEVSTFKSICSEGTPGGGTIDVAVFYVVHEDRDA